MGQFIASKLLLQHPDMLKSKSDIKVISSSILYLALLPFDQLQRKQCVYLLYIFSRIISRHYISLHSSCCIIVQHQWLLKKVSCTAIYNSTTVSLPQYLFIGHQGISFWGKQAISHLKYPTTKSLLHWNLAEARLLLEDFQVLSLGVQNRMNLSNQTSEIELRVGQLSQ